MMVSALGLQTYVLVKSSADRLNLLAASETHAQQDARVLEQQEVEEDADQNVQPDPHRLSAQHQQRLLSRR